MIFQWMSTFKAKMTKVIEFERFERRGPRVYSTSRRFPQIEKMPIHTARQDSEIAGHLSQLVLARRPFVWSHINFPFVLVWSNAVSSWEK
jgi:hypothetical protein